MPGGDVTGGNAVLWGRSVVVTYGDSDVMDVDVMS